MDVRQWKLGPMDNFVYLLSEGGEGLLVDPAYDLPRLAAELRATGVRVTHILVTHGHPDHTMGVAAMKKELGALVVAHESADHPVDLKVADGATLRLAGLEVRVVHTPGHRFDAVCYVVDGTHLLTGDTLFVGECGRVDLPGSDVRAMHRTLTDVLPSLPHDLVVLPGHDYGKTPTSTLAEELRTNDTLRPRTLEEFERFMREP